MSGFCDPPDPEKEGRSQIRPCSWGLRPVRTVCDALPSLPSPEVGAARSLPKTGSEPAKPRAAPSLRPPEAGARCVQADLRQRQSARRGRGSSRHAARGAGSGISQRSEWAGCPRGERARAPALRGTETERRAVGKQAYVWGRPGCCAVLPGPGRPGRPRRWRRGEAGDPQGARANGSSCRLPRRPRAAQSTCRVQGARPRRDSAGDVPTPLPRRAGSPDRPDSDVEGKSAHDLARVADAGRPVEDRAPRGLVAGSSTPPGKPELTDGGGGRWHRGEEDAGEGGVDPEFICTERSSDLFAGKRNSWILPAPGLRLGGSALPEPGLGTVSWST